LSLTNETKITLLQLAREAIGYYLATGNRMTPSSQADPALREKRGVFVTLHRSGQLRGCVGYDQPVKPLAQAVTDSAFSAAFEDSRFNPVGKQELGTIDIEISCLTPPQPCEDWRRIQLGRDGIILRKQFNKALFLPCVAVEQQWDLETTLSHLATKAGLGSEEWRKGAEFSTFQAEVFTERK
jgi:AmmeMemoRadiSam system protein A